MVGDAGRLKTAPTRPYLQDRPYVVMMAMQKEQIGIIDERWWGMADGADIDKRGLSLLRLGHDVLDQYTEALSEQSLTS